MNTLKPLQGESKKKEIRFAVADIEAHDWINFDCIGFYDGFNQEYRYFESLKTFTDDIFDYCKANKLTSVFAHNGGKYDFNFFLSSMLFNKRFKVIDMIPRGSGLLCFSIVEVKSKSKKKFKLTFRDSIALLPFGLRKLGQSFKVNVQKEEIDYKNAKYIFEDKDYVPVMMKNEKFKVFFKGKLLKNYKKGFHSHKFITYEDHSGHEVIKHKKIYTKDDYKSYLKSDCISLYQILEKFYSWPLVQKAGGCFTIASQAVKISRLYLDEPIYKISERPDKFIREGYFGGRTEVFRPLFDSKYDTRKNKAQFEKSALKEFQKQRKHKSLKYYDVNSLYPFCMLNELPIRLIGHCEGNHYHKNRMGAWKAEIFVPPEIKIPPLPIKHVFADRTEKLIFPTGLVKGVWSTYEIEYAKSLGCEVKKIHEGYTFENGGKIFKKYINALYAMRLKAKERGDGVTDLLCKLLMNSTYGKFGIVIERESLEIDVGQAGVKFHSEVTKRDSGETVRLVSKEKVLKTSFVNVAIPFYITSYARVHMHKNVIRKAGYDNCYYMDTDSLFTTTTFKEGDKLGELKMEYEMSSACFLLPKTYINDGVEGESFTKKLTMKGFDKRKIKNFTFSDFRDTLRGETDKLLSQQDSKFATLKTALQKGRFLAMMNDPETDRVVDKERLEKDQEHLNYLLSIHPLHVNQDIRDDIKRTKARIKNRQKKIDGDYAPSTRGIKSKYDKRIISDDLMKSCAIHLGEERKEKGEQS
jgi:hypothetical protein